MENEITVLVSIDYDNLDKILKAKGFKIVDEYTVDDIYMINKDIDLSKLNKLEILSKCVLIRNISPNHKYLTYKYKVYDEFENIIEQHTTCLL